MQIHQQVKMIMNGDTDKNVSLLELILLLASKAYATIVRFRYALYSWGILKVKKLPCVVISIGNLTVGGTGKTPMSIYIAKLLDRQGYNVAVISRGYKGGAEQTGGMLSDGKMLYMDGSEAGDEPLMMAIQLTGIPVFVGKRRFDMGLLAKQMVNSEIIVLDDAFQHIQLKRDIDLVLLDSQKPFGNTYMVPRGVMREPISGLIRADACIITRHHPQAAVPLNHPEKFLKHPLKEKIIDKPVFKTHHIPYCFKVNKGARASVNEASYPPVSYDFDFLKNKKILAFSGIAGNQHFRQTIEEIPCNIYDCLEYPDHYRYADEDLDRIVKKAQEQNIEYILTTDKDFMRIYSSLPWPVDLVVVGVEISFEDEGAFQRFMKTRLHAIIDEHR